MTAQPRERAQPASRDPLAPPRALRLGQYVGLVIVVIGFAAPLYWLLVSSLKRPEEIYRFPPVWLPTDIFIGNFSAAWQAAPFSRYAFNSIFTVSAGTIAELCIATLCAFAFAFLPFPLKNVFFAVLLGAMMVPGHVVLLPNYLTISNLGWDNTYAGLIVPGLGSVFVTFLLRQHMITLPRELLEAAELDGAGSLRTLWSVVVPLSRPMLITGGLITFITKWNEYVWPLVATSTEEMRTLPVGLVFLRTSEGGTNWGAVMAGTIFVAAPMLIAYFAAQRYIVAGITQGAVKS